MKHDSRGTYEGTSDLVEVLIAESKYAYGWRPLRAAMMMALREVTEDGKVYMTAEAFEAWVAEAKALAKARKDGMTPTLVLGLSSYQIRAIATGSHGKAATGVTNKAIALACAHYSVGLPMPVEPLDHRAFDAWFRPRFNGHERVAQWMGVNGKTLADRLRGYALREEDRILREPEAYWIRALDWLDRVGPVNPFGEKEPVEIWPGRAEGLKS